MIKLKHFGIVFLLILGCQKEKDLKIEESNKEIHIDSINLSCIPVSMDITDSDYNILGYSFNNPSSVPNLFDFKFLNINISDRKIQDTIIQHNQDENYRETPFKIKTNDKDVLMLGKYNHWDDFSDIYLYPYLIYQSKSGNLKWEASIANRRSLSNNFHVFNNHLFLFTTSFPSNNSYFSLTTDILNFDGKIEKSIKIDSVNILVQTSLQLKSTEFIVVGRTDYNNANDIQLYSVDTLGKKNWYDTKSIEHHVDFKSIIQVDNSLLILGNVLNAGLGLIYRYDLDNKSISIFSNNYNSTLFDIITTGNYVYLLRGEIKNEILNAGYLDIYSTSGELIRSVLLKKYNNTKSLAFDLDSEDNIVIIGDINDKLYFTRLNLNGDILE